MSGWILAMNHGDGFAGQVERFKKNFSPANLPPLKTRETPVGKGITLLSWAWTGHRDYPDLSFSLDQDKGLLCVVDGVITDLGVYGPSDRAPGITAKKVAGLWLEKGRAMIPELNGSFSITILDNRSGEVVCISDRTGSRACWYSLEGQARWFGNFPAALALMREKVNLDGAGLWSLLATSRPLADRGLFFEVRAIPAGRAARFDSHGKIELEQWFELCYRPENGVSATEWGGRIAEGLKKSARRILEFSATPHLYLSGGLDSRIAAGALGSPARSVTLTTSPNMNSRIAQRTAKHLGMRHHTQVRDTHWYLEHFETASLIAGGNYNIQHAHFIEDAARRTVSQTPASFLLGDMLENFNKHYFRPGTLEPGETVIPGDLPGRFNRLYAYTYRDFADVEHLLTPGTGGRCREAWAAEVTDAVRRMTGVSADERDVVDAFFRWGDSKCCPTNLMHDSIKPFAQVRNLMWDNHMLDLLLKIPADLKSRGVLHKKTLAALDRGLLWIPNSNFWLPPVVPRWMNRAARKVRPILGRLRRKILATGGKNRGPVQKTEGSWHMLYSLYRKDPRHKNFIQAVLADKTALPPEVVSPGAAKDCWQAFLAGDTSKLFLVDTLLSFGLLQRRIQASGIKF